MELLIFIAKSLGLCAFCLLAYVALTWMFEEADRLKKEREHGRG
jgi:cbb3-type cytochrome oxidase subunit 3